MSDTVWLAWIGLAASILGPISLAYAGWIKAKSMNKKIDDVHTIVNQQRTDMLTKISNLEDTIRLLIKDRDDVTRGKTLMDTAADAAKDLLHKAEIKADNLKGH